MNDDQNLSLADEIELYGKAIEALMHRLGKQGRTQIVKLEVNFMNGEWKIGAEDADPNPDPTDDLADSQGDHYWGGSGKTVAQAIAAMKQVY